MPRELPASKAIGEYLRPTPDHSPRGSRADEPLPPIREYIKKYARSTPSFDIKDLDVLGALFTDLERNGYFLEVVRKERYISYLLMISQALREHGSNAREDYQGLPAGQLI